MMSARWRLLGAVALLAATLVGFALVWGNAAAAEAEKPEGTAWKVAGELVIDGLLDDWNTSAPFPLNEEEQMIAGANFWEGVENGTATVFAMWDAENLYIAAVILDDGPYMSRMGFGPEEADSIGIFFSTDPGADPAREAYDATDFHVLFILDGSEFNTAIMRDMVADPKGISTIGEYSYEQVLDGYEAAMMGGVWSMLMSTVLGFSMLAALSTLQQVSVWVPSPVTANGLYTCFTPSRV